MPRRGGGRGRCAVGALDVASPARVLPSTAAGPPSASIPKRATSYEVVAGRPDDTSSADRGGRPPTTMIATPTSTPRRLLPVGLASTGSTRRPGSGRRRPSSASRRPGPGCGGGRGGGWDLDRRRSGFVGQRRVGLGRRRHRGGRYSGTSATAATAATSGTSASAPPAPSNRCSRQATNWPSSLSETSCITPRPNCAGLPVMARSVMHLDVGRRRRPRRPW